MAIFCLLGLFSGKFFLQIKDIIRKSFLTEIVHFAEIIKKHPKINVPIFNDHLY